MARIRTIKPDAFTSFTLSSVPRGTRWTFAGLWTYADDKGRARDDARLVHAALYPIDDATTLADVTDDLNMLHGIGGICRYIVGGRHYFHMPKWGHQKINRPTESKLPPCPLHDDSGEGEVVEFEDSVSDHGALTDDSPWEQGTGKGTGNRDEERGAGNAVAISDAPRADVEQICEHLAGAIEANGSKRPTITAKWRSAARLMLDKDGRSIEEVHGAIDWSQRDEFWRSNILSLPTLREKYDTLRLQAQRKSGGTSRTEEWRSMQERQMQRAIEREREMGMQR